MQNKSIWVLVEYSWSMVTIHFFHFLFQIYLKCHYLIFSMKAHLIFFQGFQFHLQEQRPQYRSLANTPNVPIPTFQTPIGYAQKTYQQFSDMLQPNYWSLWIVFYLVEKLGRLPHQTMPMSTGGVNLGAMILHCTQQAVLLAVPS
jgi:hypothetical protein